MMTTHTCVEILRLHCEHLRTLLDHLITDLTTLEHALAAEGSSPAGVVATPMSELAKQSQHIAIETTRLQGLMQDLEAEE